MRAFFTDPVSIFVATSITIRWRLCRVLEEWCCLIDRPTPRDLRSYIKDSKFPTDYCEEQNATVSVVYIFPESRTNIRSKRGDFSQMRAPYEKMIKLMSSFVDTTFPDIFPRDPVSTFVVPCRLGSRPVRPLTFAIPHGLRFFYRPVRTSLFNFRVGKDKDVLEIYQSRYLWCCTV